MMYQAAIIKGALAEVQTNNANAGPYIVLLFVVLGLAVYVLWNDKQKRDKLKEASESKTQENKDAAVFNIHEFKKMFTEILKENTADPEELQAKVDTRVQVALVTERQADIKTKVDGLCEDMANVSSSVSHVTNKVDLACRDIAEIKETIKTLKKE